MEQTFYALCMRVSFSPHATMRPTVNRPSAHFDSALRSMCAVCTHTTRARSTQHIATTVAPIAPDPVSARLKFNSINFPFEMRIMIFSKCNQTVEMVKAIQYSRCTVVRDASTLFLPFANAATRTHTQLTRWPPA